MISGARQKGREEGILLGEERGLEKGVQQGEAAVLKRLLKLRFGHLSATDEHKINQANTETLRYWRERIFDNKTLDDLFK